MTIMQNCGVLLERLSSPMAEKDLQAAKARKEGKDWLKKSRQIALSVLYYLEQKNMKKKDLADMMGVEPSYVVRLLKGKENLSLGTISKIEKALGVDLIHMERPYAKVETNISWSDFSQSCA